MQEMSESVRYYISNSIVSTNTLSNAVNVHFFTPGSKYRTFVDFDKGIKVFLPHGISDKGYRSGETLKDLLREHSCNP